MGANVVPYFTDKIKDLWLYGEKKRRGKKGGEKKGGEKEEVNFYIRSLQLSTNNSEA